MKQEKEEPHLIDECGIWNNFGKLIELQILMNF
jgi:hypothetical protein